MTLFCANLLGTPFCMEANRDGNTHKSLSKFFIWKNPKVRERPQNKRNLNKVIKRVVSFSWQPPYFTRFFLDPEAQVNAASRLSPVSRTRPSDTRLQIVTNEPEICSDSERNDYKKVYGNFMVISGYNDIRFGVFYVASRSFQLSRWSCANFRCQKTQRLAI